MSSVSFLEKLLDGVTIEWKAIWEVTTWDKKFNAVSRNKQSKTINYKYFLAVDLFKLEKENGSVFLLSTGERTGWTTEDLAGENVHEGEVVAIPWGKSRPLREVLKYYKGKFITADNRLASSNDTKVLLNKYLYYWLLSQASIIDSFYRGAGIQHPSMAAILDMNIPIPSIHIQAEIVRILDAMTAHTAELTAELTLRKKQYNYYRDKLLSFEDGEVEWKTLGEVAQIGTGSHDTQDAADEGDYIFYARGREPLRLNSFDFDETAIITAGDGAGVGKVFHYAQGKYALHQRAYRIAPGEFMVPRFVYHYIASHFYSYIQKASVSSSVTSLRRPMFLNFPIPVPSLIEQNRIVTILDKFDALTTSITEGLPREIQLREKQYEYYRDALLSFPKPDNINE